MLISVKLWVLSGYSANLLCSTPAKALLVVLEQLGTRGVGAPGGDDEMLK